MSAALPPVSSRQRSARLVFGTFPDFQPAIAANLDHARFDADFHSLSTPFAVDAALPLALEHYERLRGWPGAARDVAIYPTAAAAGVCEDKLALVDFLTGRGLEQAVPARREPGPPYPYVLKRRIGYWGRHAHVVRDAAQEATLDAGPADWFAQDFIPGATEYAAHILRDGGRIWYASTVCYELGRPDAVLGAHARPVRMTLTRGCVHLRGFAEILAALDYEGTACIDYKLVDGTPKIFEINPRFGASLAHDVNAYLDCYLDALAARRA